jgi:raffinose/stachyose/melibiose transport system substrate-binding protein
MSDEDKSDNRVELAPPGTEVGPPESTINRRDLIKTAVVAGGGLALLGSAGTAAARPFITRAKTTIDYWTWHHISQVPTEKGKDRIKAAFEKANPDVTLNVKLFPFPDYLTALQTAVPNGSSGDVLGMQNGALLRQYRQYLETLNPLAEKGMGKNWQAAYLTKSITLPQKNNNWPKKSDEYWWMPAEVAILGAQWYWADIFKKAGVAVPKDYAGLKEISDKLRTDGYIPTAWGAKDQWPNTDYLIVYASQFKPGVVEAAELGDAKFTDAPIVKALTFMKQTVTDNLYNTGPFGTTAYPEAYISMFAARKAAMINTGAHNISLAGTPGAQQNWRAFLFPHIPGAPQSNWLGSLPSGVPTQTGPAPSRLIFDVGYLLSMKKDLDPAKQDAAWRFIQFYVGPAGQRINSFWTQPSLKNVHITGFSNPGFVSMLNWHFKVAEFGERREFLFPETRAALQTAIENVIVNNADPGTELAKVDAAAKKARLKAGGKK